MRSAAAKAGYIYAMESDGLVKLGFSKNPDIRKYGVGRDANAPVNLAFKIPVENMARCEAAVHDRLKDKRAHGEWFTVSIEEAIECLKWAAENPKPLASVSIGCRLHPEVLARVDKRLKGESRSALVERLIMEWLG
jgi:hypothetical protein